MTKAAHPRAASSYVRRRALRRCYDADMRSLAAGLVAALGFAWALPPSLFGLVLAAFSLGRARWRNGAVWVRADRGLGAVIARWPGGPLATTFGWVVLLWHPHRFDAGLEAHELVHVRQYRWLGICFFVVYLALLPIYGRRAGHPLERRAYLREREVRGAR